MGDDDARGPFDDPRFVSRYLAHRTREGNANDLLELPAFLELLGDVRGLRVADLGGGDGGFGAMLLARGARWLVSVDSSATMIDEARRTIDPARGGVVHAAIEAWRPAIESFDIIVSRMTLHYVIELEVVLSRIRQALAPRGRFVFSVEHPVITASARSARVDRTMGEWIVDDYFVEGARSVPWLGAEVKKQHRTLGTYTTMLKKAGFSLDAISEAAPRVGAFDDPDELARRRRAPRFLIIAAT